MFYCFYFFCTLFKTPIFNCRNRNARIEHIVDNYYISSINWDTRKLENAVSNASAASSAAGRSEDSEEKKRKLNAAALVTADTH